MVSAFTDGLTFSDSTVQIAAGQTVQLSLRGSLENVRKWDVGHPELYTFTVRAGEDDLIDRTGFRTLEVNNGQVLRGSHYPQSQFWIDLLDEHGMLLWSEIPMWGCFMSKETLASPQFIERGVQMLDEMIHRDYHHPSIIFWGAHNKIDTRTEEALELTKKFVSKIRSMDNSRIVTYATMHPEEDTAGNHDCSVKTIKLTLCSRLYISFARILASSAH